MKKILIGLPLLLFVVLGIWTLRLHGRISERVKNGWFLPPVEFYTSPERFKVGMTRTLKDWKKVFDSNQFHDRTNQGKILDNTYAVMDRELCQGSVTEELAEVVSSCIAFRSQDLYLLALDSEFKIIQIFGKEPLVQAPEALLLPQLFAQYYGDQPVLRQVKSLGQFPLACLQAVTAIEDKDFLEHRGVSITGTFRAIARNMAKGRYAEGGSTLTQQLVKNYFLSAEKTISRKLTEQMMAVLIEIKFTKDQIIETYLNEIYMGQSGPFQIRGFASASQFYLRKPVEDLDIADCALLAAMINSPGRYNPFTKAEASQARRTLVLEKMFEQNMIDAREKTNLVSTPMPKRTGEEKLEPAPYFVQAVLQQLRQDGVNFDLGLKIYTSVNIDAQDVAQRVIAQGIENLEKNFPKLKKWVDKGIKLQGALLAIDIPSGRVEALVGGREFKVTQYNRAVDSMRQVGSIMKPLVYLTALENDHKPTDILADVSFKHRYEGRSWSPKNYDGKFNGEVPMYFALMNSLNAATARLALDVGLDKIIQTARMLGIESPLEPYPSLSLGAFELRIWEVARAYLAIARFGERLEPSLIDRVEDLNGEVLVQNTPEPQNSGLDPLAVGELIGMMQNTLNVGTAKVSRILGFTKIAAGKTGTTSDFKDTWFVGFTPNKLAIVWVGYDSNQSSGLTGASGSVPIWTEFMKQAYRSEEDVDFNWPVGLHDDNPTDEIKLKLRETYD